MATSLANGEPQYDTLEQQLSAMPPITVPTITVASDFDRAAADRKSYRHNSLVVFSPRSSPGVGHKVPQEHPQDLLAPLLMPPADGRAAPRHPVAGASRRRVAMTETAPAELLSRDLSGLDVAVS